MAFSVRRARVSGRYKRLRAGYLSRHPLCALCGESGLTVAASEIHHTVSAESRPDLFWDVSLWQAVCRPCHVEVTRKQNRRRSFVGCSEEGLLLED